VDAESALADGLGHLAATLEETHAIVTHDALPVVQVRRGQMEHLFQNLIGNAIKYRREGEDPRIHIGVEPDGFGWRFAVRDNGIGIPPEYKDRVFAIFKRLHKDDARYPGTGVGLAICQRIVERHGGRIWVESDGNGHGSTFYFTLPVGRCL
jgi:signal transduction histidine kinase